MKLASILFGIATMVAAAGLGTGCSGTECGLGTVEVDGACLPTSDLCGPNSTYDEDTGQCVGNTTCAAGTTLENGECVPDGSVVCATGTQYDEATGTCVADVSGCAAGTVLIEDECVPEDDALVADVEEAAEPNDVDSAGTITLPAEGDATTVHGCVTPYVDADESGDLDPDTDAFTLAVDGPTLLDVTVDGVGGLAGAVEVTSTVAALEADGWARLGLNMVGDTSRRQIFLPAAGTYVFGFGDSRSLFLGAPAGDADTCYYATLRNLAMPAASPISTAATGDFEEARFFSYDPAADGEILRELLDAPSSSAIPAITTLVDNQYVSSATGQPAADLAAGLLEGDTVLIVVDPVYDFALSPVSFELALTTDAPNELVNGAATTLTHDDDGTWTWLSGTGGEVLHFQLDSADPVAIEIFDDELESLGAVCATASPCTVADAYLQLVEDGIYYARILNTSGLAEGQTYDVTATLDSEAPFPAAIDTPSTDLPLSADGNDFYEITIDDLAWLVFTASGTDIADLELVAYDRSQAGVLGAGVPVHTAMSFTTGTEVYASILDWPAGVASMTFLVRVGDAAFDGTADTETYDIAVMSREHTVIDLDANPSFTATGETAGADPAYYLVRRAANDLVYVGATNVVGGDLVIEQLDDSEGVVASVDAAGDDGSEQFDLFSPSPGWFALAVSSATATDVTYDLALDYQAPDAAETMVVDTAAVDGGAAVTSDIEITADCAIDFLSLDIASTNGLDNEVELRLISPSGLDVWINGYTGGPLNGNIPLEIPGDTGDFTGEEALGTWTISYQFNSGWGGLLGDALFESWGLNIYCE